MNGNKISTIEMFVIELFARYIWGKTYLEFMNLRKLCVMFCLCMCGFSAPEKAHSFFRFFEGTLTPAP